MRIRTTEFLKAIKTPAKAFTTPLGPHEARVLIRRILLNGTAPKALDTDLVGVEIAGRIAELGLDAVASGRWPGFSVGGQVAVRSVTGCGRCDRCLAAMPMACDLATDGPVEVEVIESGQNLALYLRVAATKAHLESFEKTPGGEAAALVPSTVAEAFAATHRNYAGGGAAIIGAGASGLTILQILRTMGVRNIGVVDYDAARLAAAVSFGADPIDANDPDVPAALTRLRDDGIFTVFVTGDTPSSAKRRAADVHHAAQACAPGGALVFTRGGFDCRDVVPWNLVEHKALTLVPTPAVDREATDVAAQHVKFHGIDVSRFVTHRLDFEEAAHAMDVIEHGEGLIKLALRPRTSAPISLADAAGW